MKDFLHHFFLPRESNNHRPKLLHHNSLLTLIISLFILALFLPSLQRDFPSVLGISNNITVENLLSHTNQKRQEQGLEPLVLNEQLSQAAAKKAQDMFTNNYWAHISPHGTTPWSFIRNTGYEYIYAGENLARGFSDSPDVVNAWMASQSHKDNILSPNYKEVGYAVLTGTLTGSETVLVVQMFGNRYIAAESSEPHLPDVVAVVIPSVTPQYLPSVIPSPLPTEPVTIAVAAIQQKPLIDSKSSTKNISIFLVLLFIAILIADAIIIERKKIARVVSHNLDHVFFLMFLMVAVIIIGKGTVL